MMMMMTMIVIVPLWDVAIRLLVIFLGSACSFIQSNDDPCEVDRHKYPYDDDDDNDSDTISRHIPLFS